MKLRSKEQDLEAMTF